MANLKSDVITKEEAGQLPRHYTGNIKVQDAVITLAAGSLDINNTLQLVRVNTDDKLISVKITSPDWGSAGDCDIGFYEVAADGSLGAAITVDCLADALDMNTAAKTDFEVRYSNLTRATANQQMYQVAELSTRPEFKEMFLVIKVVAAGTITSGTIHVQVTTSSV